MEQQRLAKQQRRDQQMQAATTREGGQERILHHRTTKAESTWTTHEPDPRVDELTQMFQMLVLDWPLQT
jgi:adenosyl cobinamide kinase/adenosyl cobinamide phosphate guanylyltransferase